MGVSLSEPLKNSHSSSSVAVIALEMLGWVIYRTMHNGGEPK